MKLEVTDTKLPEVKVIRCLTNFQDHRGRYLELFNNRAYTEAGVDLRFVQDDVSISSKNVLRGIHGDNNTWKLISCVYGKFYLVIVNNDPISKDYRVWESFTLSATNGMQVLVPPKHGNGHLVVSEFAVFHYKQTTEYDREGQFTIIWNDPDYGIWWPTVDPITSQRDSSL